MKFGIDLGTTNSLITYWIKLPNNTFQLNTLTNEFGSTQTQSVVHFEEDTNEVIVGEVALSNYSQYPESTIRWVKRFMGKDKKYPIYNDIYTPQEISALILKNLKELAENQGELEKGEIKEIVITVPADFDQNAKKATEDAARIAGFEKIYLIPEPNAAILSYIYRTRQIGKIDKILRKGNNHFLVFDLGGGTFDVSLSRVELDENNKTNVSIISSAGNKYLGGVNFDLDLVKYVLEKVMKTNESQAESMKELIVNFDKYYKKNESIDEDIKLVLTTLTELCEQTKIALSSAKRKSLMFFNQNGQAIKTVISRNEFELILEPYIEQMNNLIKKVLIDATRNTKDEFNSWKQLDIALLVGGSSNIPLIKKFCEETFKSTTKSGIDTFEAISQGAAIYAGIKNNEVETFAGYNQIVPHDYGIMKNGELVKILQKGARVCKGTWQYSVPFALDTKAPIVIAQKFYNEDGEDIYPEIEKINYFHPFILTNDKLNIEFSLDDNMMLKVIVKEPRINDKIETIVDSAIGLTEEQIRSSKKRIEMGER